MAFFDKLTKSVTEASQKTIAKTKELADTTKLNAMISEQEKNLNSLYQELGRKYAETHADDYEETFADLMAAIANGEATISDYKQQIRDIKGVMTCEKCGADIPAGAAFCTGCGAPAPVVVKPVAPGALRCENCGAEVQKDMRFCISCGKPLNAAPVAEPVSGVTCPNCGAQLESGSAFCTECGTAL